MTAPIAEAQLGIISSLLGLIRIQGTVYCTPNGNMGVNGTSTPVFSNAVVQLKCGSSGNVVSSATTDGSGIFSMVLDPLNFVLSSLLSDCKLVVSTPLSTATPLCFQLVVCSRPCSSSATHSSFSLTSPTSFLLDSASSQH